RVLLGLHSSLLGLVPGIFGLALFIMAMFTEHTVTWRNENLFLANPLTFCALPLGIAAALGKPWARNALKILWTALLGLGVLLLPLKATVGAFDQNNWNVIALLLPVSALCAGAFWLGRVFKASPRLVTSAPPPVVAPDRAA